MPIRKKPCPLRTSASRQLRAKSSGLCTAHCSAKSSRTTPRKLVNAVQALHFPHAFNPYSDYCNLYDKSTAASQRRSILRKSLEAAAQTGVDAIWLGRDLGYRGGRRTGLAMTDDVHFKEHIARWGFKANRPSKGDHVAERTATMVWSMLSQIEQPVYLWNVFPLHPHEPKKPFSNRAHTAAERDSGLEILQLLIQLLRPQRLVAIGNDAAICSAHVVAPDRIEKVRHPSYGGYSAFTQSIRKLYTLSED